MQWKSILVVSIGVLLSSGCKNSHIAAKPIVDDPYANLKNSLCDRQIVLLGEGPSHDEGATIAYKSQIAQDLVQDCGFSLLVFESSFYQFVDLNRDLSAGKHVSREEIDAAIGWLWRNQVEIEPLLKLLHEQANNGQVTIAGMDDQISGRGQDYANFDLPNELTETLQRERRTKCREALNRHVLYDYKDDDPYDEAKKQFILSCLQSPEDSEGEQMTAMRASLTRDFQRDHLGHEAGFAGRARSMYENFEYWFDNYGKPKTIIWSSTIHAAKRGPVNFGDVPNTGKLVQNRFGDDAYVLGFSALSGTRGRPGRDAKTLPKAPDNALESMVFKDIDDDFVFLDSETLAAFGAAPAAGIGNKYETREWVRLLDGLVVLRTQRPQTPMPAIPPPALPHGGGDPF